MAAQELDSIPLVAFDPVANAQNEWVALCLRVASGDDMPARLQAVFGMPDLLAAIAPLDGLLMVDSPAALTHPVLALLPANRIGFVVPAGALLEEGAVRRLGELHEAGYRVWLDGAVPEGVKAPAALRSVARDCSRDAPPSGRLAALFGPHLARNVGSAQRFSECENAGFDWFSGDYPIDLASFPSPSDDGSSRRRLLTRATGTTSRSRTSARTGSSRGSGTARAAVPSGWRSSVLVSCPLGTLRCQPSSSPPLRRRSVMP